MRLRFLAFVSITAATAALPIVACSSEAPAPSRLVLTDDDSGSPTKPRTDAQADSTTPPPPADGGAGPSRVYAHTADTLYLFDAASKTVSIIGKFSCLDPTDSVLDIAVDRTGAMFGTTYQGFISVDPISANCTIVQSGSYPNSLSFVPAGTVDATKEALVGYAYNTTNFLADHYVRIDTSTGGITDLGDLNPVGAQTTYRASGDLISLIQAGNKTYLTVKKTPPDAGTDTTTDYLAEIDPTTGMLVKVLGPTGVPNLYGFGYWAGTGYGFAFDGRVISIDMTNGSSTVLLTLKGADGGILPWYGAGVTTQAPVTP
jgi:hypothetical protein